MDMSAIKTQLETVSSLIQVIEAAPGGFDVPVDSGAELYTLLSGLVSNRVYPVTNEGRLTLPQIVYTLSGSESIELEGYRITQTDTFVLTVRTATHDAMVGLINSIVTAVRGSSYAIDLVDYEQSHEPEFAEGAYRTDIEIDFSYLVDATGGPSSAFSSELPMAIIYPVGRSADASIADNLIMQEVINQYAVVIATNAGDMSTLLDDVRAAMLGFQQSASFHDMEYVSGANLGGVGTMSLWREIYQDYTHIREA